MTSPSRRQAPNENGSSGTSASEKHLVEVWASEVGLPSRKYGSHKRFFRRAAITPRACLIEYPGIEAAQITIRGFTLTVYRTWDDVWNSHSIHWTSDREDATRYARRADGIYTTARR